MLVTRQSKLTPESQTLADTAYAAVEALVKRPVPFTGTVTFSVVNGRAYEIEVTRETQEHPSR